MTSLKSRFTNASNRTSVVGALQPPGTACSGRLSLVDDEEEELDLDNVQVNEFADQPGQLFAKCEVTACVINEEDLTMCDEISKTMQEEKNLQTAYNAFRKRKGLTLVDFTSVDG